MSVHVNGIIRFLGNSELENILRKTSLHFENYNQQSTTIFDNLSAEYRNKLLNAIAAFEVEIIKMDNVFKLTRTETLKVTIVL